MRKLLIALLMTLATQVGAEVQVSLSNVVSDAQIVNGDNKFTGQVIEYDEIDKTGADEETGVNWLDTVEHMLVLFGESRTEACSGIVVADYDQP